MTEAEALKKICPMLPFYQDAPSLCHASNCMAWRTAMERVERPASMGMPDGEGWLIDGAPTGAGGAVSHRQKWKRATGFCGLAGDRNYL